MTTPAAERLYEAQHVHAHEGLRAVVHNPNGLPLDQLPIIFGFNNGGSHGWMQAALIAQDGTVLGGHTCTSEAYMPHDLGILEGTRPDRHATFAEHYPNGYRMQFVGFDEYKTCDGLQAAVKLHEARNTEVTPISKATA